MGEENSISIINRGRQVIGEKANSLPVRITTSLSGLKLFFIGCVVGALVLVILMSTSLNQVVAVEVSGKANNFEILKLQ